MTKDSEAFVYYKWKVPESDKYFPTIFSCVQAKRRYFFDGDRNNSRKLYNATCVTYNDEDVVVITFLKDSNVQVQARYITFPEYTKQMCKIKGTIIWFYCTVQIFQLTISSSRSLFLIFIKTDHQIKNQMVVLWRFTNTLLCATLHLSILLLLSCSMMSHWVFIKKLSPDKYFTKLRHCKEIINIAVCEQVSLNAIDQENYTEEIFLTHLIWIND